MPFPIDLTRSLAYAPVDSQLDVCTIPSDALRARLALAGLYERDRITCSADVSGNVVVHTAEGREIMVDRPCAIMIEVEPSSVRPRAVAQASSANETLSFSNH